MKRLTALLLVLSALLAAPAVSQGFRLEGLDGSSLSQEALESGDWVIVVWASWSPRARDIGPRIDALAGELSGRARVCGVHFQDTPAEVRKSLGAQRPDAPLYVDARGDFSKKYQVSDLPSLLILRQGRVVHKGRLTADPVSVASPLLGTS
ncbi:MAG: TlpA disulfide reductase family protein [Acidobacteriota bacterium]